MFDLTSPAGTLGRITHATNHLRSATLRGFCYDLSKKVDVEIDTPDDGLRSACFLAAKEALAGLRAADKASTGMRQETSAPASIRYDRRKRQFAPPAFI